VNVVTPTLSRPRLSGSTLTLSGLGIPGETIEVVAGAVSLGEALVDADGRWVLSSEASPGDYRLQVLRRDEAGEVTALSPATDFNVPENAPVVSIDEPAVAADAAVTTSETAIASEAVTTTATATATNGITASGSITSSEELDTGDTNAAAGRPTLTGAGAPGDVIEIVRNGTVIATATVGEDGVWSYTLVGESEGDTNASGSITASGGITGSASITGSTVITETTLAVQLRNQPETRTQPVVVLVPIVVAQEGAAGADPGTTAAAAPSADAEDQEAATADAPVEDAAADNVGTGEGQAYVVQPGDTLTTLAQEYLGDQARYREIVAATNEKAATDPAIDAITNPDVITVGQTIWIPAE
jgi:hypothetical protein